MEDNDVMEETAKTEETIKDRINEFIKTKRLKKKDFEQLCQLSPGYLSTMRKGFGAERLQNVLKAFPDLNRNWLIYGEGEMLKPQNVVTDSALNDGGINVKGNNNKNINSVGAVNETLLQTLSEQQKITLTAQEALAKAQQQIDKLLQLLEKSQNNQ